MKLVTNTHIKEIEIVTNMELCIPINQIEFQ